MGKTINIIFPHQLFERSPLLDNGHEIWLIEEYLYFKQYAFHQQKIAFHRASMKYYQDYLEGKGLTVRYIESSEKDSNILNLGQILSEQNITTIHCINPTDNWLEKRIKKLDKDCEIIFYNNPLFLNTLEDLNHFFKKDKTSFFQTTFYKQERKKRQILIDQDQNPIGGKWTFDTENRKKYPKKKQPPIIHFPQSNPYWIEAVAYTKNYFNHHLGEVSKDAIYPVTHQEAKDWLKQFLELRFYDFGAYEDAIVKEHLILNHSVLSPLLNAGLLEPQMVIDESIRFAEQENIPINSLEGFIRQIIGWREFIRGMYVSKGTYSRNLNFWGFKRKIPASFYTGTTGIAPIDTTIKKVLKTGYCHHIERLMILGNFMLLCEFDPDEVYRWFMELFIDAYDWVMVPNIYGMSQFADGGTFATKPYIGGSNYIKKMSNYPKGDWEATWNGLFWSFIDRHLDFFLKNPRMSMMGHTYNRMDASKKEIHLKNADEFIQNVLGG